MGITGACWSLEGAQAILGSAPSTPAAIRAPTGTGNINEEHQRNHLVATSWIRPRRLTLTSRRATPKRHPRH